MKGEGQQKARGLGAFRGESRRRACYSSRIWGQFPSRLFFLEPLLLPLKRLPRCSAPPAGSRAPGIPRGRREDDDRPLTVVRGDAGLSVPGPALFPSICFPNAAGGRCAECPMSFFPFFLPFSFLPSFPCPPLQPESTDACASAAARLSLPSQRLPTASRGVERCRLPGTSGRARSCPRVERLAPGKRAEKALGVWKPYLHLLLWAMVVFRPLVYALRRHVKFQPSRRQYKIINYH